MKNKYRYLTVSAFLLLSLLLCQNPLKAQVNFESWMPLGTGTAGATPGVRSLAYVDTSHVTSTLLFAGGKFDSVGGVKVNHIARWSVAANTWSALGGGANGEVDAIALFKRTIYAGGKFDTAGGIHANHIASCNSANIWDSLQGGLNGDVYALFVYHNALYVGGSFTIANGITVNRIAKWDNTGWDSVGSGFDSNTVYALASYNDTLYAGGSFTKSGGQTVNYIAKWTGSKWVAVGSGANAPVYALDSCPFLQNNTRCLYAGGAFTMFNGFRANHIVSYDSARWDSLGSGTNDTVRALYECNGILGVSIGRIAYIQETDLMVGGNFTQEGNIKSSYLGYWDGTMWDSLGYTNKPVYAIASSRPFTSPPVINFVGGDFDSTYSCYINRNWIQANYVASLQYSLGGGIDEIYNHSSTKIYPNPNNGKFAVQCSVETQHLVSKIKIYNMLGQRIYSKPFNIQNSTFTINLSSQPAGIYLYRVITQTGKLIGEGKFVIEK